jgi:hypothetical protein
MQTPFNPLTVILDPPGEQAGVPGDTLDLHAVISNQGHQGAVIDVFFDEMSQTLHQWCKSPRERLALDPQQSSEVTFQFQIPFEALPGTYDYTLVVDAPEHYPEDTPIQYPLQIKVLLKEQTVIRVNDPTFSLNPATNPSSLAVLKLGEPLQVVATVNNRSNRVDSFRLTCLDLEEDWFTIRHFSTGLEGPGLVPGVSGLELNPATQGQILVQFHPPADTLAGNYSPTLRLHSANNLELVLLDLVYIQILPVYTLDVELVTILGKVGRRSGQYKIQMANRGNTLRELAVSTRSRDEEELCTYQCEPTEVRILPSKTIGVSLVVKPIDWWRRPLIGAGLVLNFIVEFQDAQALPLPEKLPQGIMVWKARPWWQFLLLILAALGLLGATSLIIWMLLKPPAPPEVVSFTADSLNYIEGNLVRLSWKINNFNQLSQLELASTGPVSARPVLFNFSQGIPENLKRLCEVQERILTCNNFNTGAKKPGDYTFTLKASARKQGIAVEPKALKVKIAEKPAPEAVNLQLDKDQYTKGDRMLLSWEVQNQEQLSQLKIIGKIEGGAATLIEKYKFNQGRIPAELSKVNSDTLQPLCQAKSQTLTCTKVPVATPKPGKYTFELQAFSKPDKLPKSKPAETIVEVLPKPFKIVFFTLNGREEPTRELKEGEQVTLEWQVEGEDITVVLSPFGNVSPSGSKPLKADSALPPQMELVVSDRAGRTTTKGFSIKVKTPLHSLQPPSPGSSSSSQAPQVPSSSSQAPPPIPPPRPTAPDDQGI